jgi:prepilin-type N-terminal cleavage/methylation domain-containing protein
MKMKNNKQGFTIVEVLIVVAIIGILATFMIVSYDRSLKKGRDAKRESDLESVKLACNMYADKNGAYPDDTGGFSGLAIPLADYMDISGIEDPQDPDYAYSYVEDGTRGCILTYYSEIDEENKEIYCKD